MSAALRESLVRFLDALEAIGAEHEEVYDTDVRERLAAVIDHRLVTTSHEVAVPHELGMFSPAARCRSSVAARSLPPTEASRNGP